MFVDHVFDQGSSNAMVYELLTKDIIHAAVQGFNGTFSPLSTSTIIFVAPLFPSPSYVEFITLMKTVRQIQVVNYLTRLLYKSCVKA